MLEEKERFLKTITKELLASSFIIFLGLLFYNLIGQEKYNEEANHNSLKDHEKEVEMEGRREFIGGYIFFYKERPPMTIFYFPSISFTSFILWFFRTGSQETLAR